MSEKNNSTFIIGVLVGAALTYLFTTENGRRLKGELLKEGSKLLETIGEGIMEGEEAAKKIEKKLEAPAGEIASTVKDTVAAIPEQVEQIQKKGRRFFFSKKPHTHES